MLARTRWMLVVLFVTVGVGIFEGSDNPRNGRTDSLSVTTTPRYSQQPARVTIHIRHDPEPDDRGMTVEADSADFLRSSTFPLDGAESSRLHTVVLKALPAGEYRVRVVVHRNGDEAVEVLSTFTVCRGGGVT